MPDKRDQDAVDTPHSDDEPLVIPAHMNPNGS
jgi:hypothetical protein